METGEETSHQELKVFVPAELKKIFLNGQQTFQEKPVTLASLNPGDRLKVQYDYRRPPATWPTGWRRYVRSSSKACWPRILTDAC